MDKDLYKFDEFIPEPEIPPTQFIEELVGQFQTVSAVPTAAPKNLLNQIQFYSNGSTYRLYIYDKTNNVWRFVVLL